MGEFMAHTEMLVDVRRRRNAAYHEGTSRRHQKLIRNVSISSTKEKVKHDIPRMIGTPAIVSPYIEYKGERVTESRQGQYDATLITRHLPSRRMSREVCP
jgi:hypothetical protein